MEFAKLSLKVLYVDTLFIFITFFSTVFHVVRKVLQSTP